ncbi:hypothetical protein WAI453_005250 [Rhynchosporium graminicola]
MKFSNGAQRMRKHLAVTLISVVFVHISMAAPLNSRNEFSDIDPFAILDKQDWVNPDDMTWDDWKDSPGTNWSDPTVRGTNRNFNIALVTVDYSDGPSSLCLQIQQSSTIHNLMRQLSFVRLSQPSIETS